MMKKLMAFAMLAAAFSFGATNDVAAQSSYKNAVGMRIDFGDGDTYVGPSFKHFFTANNVGEAHLMFGDRVTVLGVEYQYHGQIANAAGLRWVAGLGPSLAFIKGFDKTHTHLWFRPVVGLDYKINNVPLNIGFDWRPILTTASNVSNRFEPARFGIAFRYAF